MQKWLRAMVEEVQAGERTNPPGDAPVTPALELQLALKEAGRENEVTEAEMVEAFESLGVTDEDAMEEALEQFASWL